MAGASCHRCGETLREPLRHLEGKSLEVAGGNWTHRHTTVHSLLILYFCLGIFVSLFGVDPNSGPKKQIHKYSQHGIFYAFLFIFEGKKSQRGWAGFKLRPLQPVL